MAIRRYSTVSCQRLSSICISFQVVIIPPQLTGIRAGNVIANQGFQQRLGFQNSQGKYYLKAQYTALWGAMQSLGQLLGMVFLNPVSDRLGRKTTLYVLWIILVGV